MSYLFKRRSLAVWLGLLLVLSGCTTAQGRQAPGAPTTVTVTAKPAQPTITNLNPSTAAVGASVTITGSGFSATQGAATVTFNGTAVTSVTSWSALSLTVLVPTGATTGNVVVTQNGLMSAGSAFTVGSVSCTYPHPAGFPSGSEGSCFPDASTTGPTGTLTPSGSITTSSPGQLIQNVHVTGLIRVDAAHWGTGVIIRNVKITCPGGSGCVALRGDGFLIEDSEIEGPMNTNAASSNDGWNYIMRRVHIHSYGEGPGNCNGVLIEDSFIHITTPYSGAHQDDIQCEPAGSSNNIFRHNTLFVALSQNASIQHGAHASSINNLAELNLMGGGSFTVSAGGEIAVNNNYFTTMFFPNSGSAGPIAFFPPHSATSCGNRWYDGPNTNQLLSGESVC